MILVLLGGLGFYFFQKVSKLETHYVLTSYSEDSGVEYKIIKDKPKSWVSLKNLDQKIYGAFVVSEDWAFFDHEGIDVEQIKKAYEDFQKGESLRGASTITQQTVKNLFLSPERSFVRKGVEALLAVLMTKTVTKEKTLEIYLNVIEFGEGLYGLGPASQYYFNKQAISLNAKEASFLAMLLPNPKTYSSSFRDQELSEYARSTIESILLKMRVAGYLKPYEYQYASLIDLF